MDSTATSNSSITYSNSKPSIEQGWECPRCGRINAPWVRQCDCSRNDWTIAISKDGTYKPEQWKDITCNPDTFRIHPEDGPIWKSDSATVSKSNPDITYTYITNPNSIAGGSDYWDPISHTYRNTLKDNLNNIKG